MLHSPQIHGGQNGNDSSITETPHPLDVDVAHTVYRNKWGFDSIAMTATLILWIILPAPQAFLHGPHLQLSEAAVLSAEKPCA